MPRLRGADELPARCLRSVPTYHSVVTEMARTAAELARLEEQHPEWRKERLREELRAPWRA
jgi:hypothetical protein